MNNETEVAILFADVVGSTRLYEVLGDRRARDTILTCVEVMRGATERNRGSVIKTIGDEILAIFPTADDAVNAAAEMQHDVGVHPGLLIDGQHVAIRAVTRQIDLTPVRGHREDVELFEILWQQEDATSMLPSIAIDARTGHRPRRVRLRYQGREYVLGEGRDTLTLGRAEDNDIVVKGDLISRFHARVELARHKFLLVDQSTNGSFVTSPGGKESFVRRDSVALEGQGLIGLGHIPEPRSNDSIQYRVED